MNAKTIRNEYGTINAAIAVLIVRKPMKKFCPLWMKSVFVNFESFSFSWYFIFTFYTNEEFEKIQKCIEV